MTCRSLILFSFAAALLVAGCSDDTTQTSTVSVRTNPEADFSRFETFSVVTKDLVDPPDLDPDQEAFNDYVNGLIIDAMQAEPVCLTYIPADSVTDENEPDLWAANGLARTVDGGYYYECCGGYYWGYWGWYWDPCAYWCPEYVEYEVGNMLIPVGRRPAASGADPIAVFGGLAQSITGTGPDSRTKAREGVEAIFQQWPEKRTCPTSP